MIGVPQLVVTNSTRQCSSHNRIVICQIACDRREYLFVTSFRFPRAVEAEASAWTIKPIGYCMANGRFAFPRSARQAEDPLCVSSPVDPVLDLGQNAVSSTWETTLGGISPGTVHVYHVLEVQIVDWSTG